jgi:biopolymer transport protein ExbD
MKKSARARRMERRHKRHRGTATLSLTSLMDIFTILVFFLLVNSSNNQQLPDNENITLPESNAEELPEEILTIQVSNQAVIIENTRVADVKEILQSEEDVVPALVQELKRRAERTIPTGDTEEDSQEQPGRKVMILGDREIPYKLLQKIMMSCNRTDYTRISFAVLRKAEEEG